MSVLPLQRRILLTFIASSTLVGLLFGLCAMIFAYHTEDQLFASLLHAEAADAEQQLAAGRTIAPRLPFVHYVTDITALPAPIQTMLALAPERREFALESGRHYHLLSLSQGFLLADVTDQLIVRAIRPQLAELLMLLLAVVLLCSAGFAYVLAKRVLKPLYKLTQQVDSTALQPDQPLSSGFADDFAADEIGRLARALQDAWQRVAEFIGREQQFTQDVSHELRTPLTVMQGALTLLRHSPLTPQQLQVLERLQQAQQQITHTIDTLMLLAREHVPAAMPVKLLPVVEQSLLQQQAKLAGKAIRLELDIAPGEELTIDRMSLLILLNNLIGNAFDYTAAGVIRISFAGQVLTVQDSGSGIEAQLQGQVFDCGVKGSNSTGMGVGLSLVRRLCDKWHIAYQLHSDTGGTCIRLTFPSS